MKSSVIFVFFLSSTFGLESLHFDNEALLRTWFQTGILHNAMAKTFEETHDILKNATNDIEPRADDKEDLGQLISPNARYFYYYMIKPALLFFLGDQINNLPPGAIDNSLIRLVASIAPVLGVQQQCSDASWTILYNMLITSQDWAMQFFDSSGKLPDGMFADYMDFCDVLDKYSVYIGGLSCEAVQSQLGLPEGLGSLRGLLNIPMGNTHAMGNFHQCLSLKSSVLQNDTLNPFHLKQDFNGSWTPVQVQMLPPEGSRREPSQPEIRLAPGIGIIGSLDLNDLSPIPLPQNVDEFLGLIKGLYIGVAEFKYATCVPDVCTLDDIGKNNYHIFKAMGGKADPVGRQITESNKREEPDNFSQSIMVIFGIIGSLMLVGTLVELWQELNPFPILSVREELFVTKLFKSFSILKNGRQIWSTDGVQNKNHLACLDGLRAISMMWIIYGHLYLISMFLSFMGFVINRNFVEEAAKGTKAGFGHALVNNAFPAVDTFFFMSGLLVAYLSLSEMSKGRFNLVYFYIHRFIRLGIPLALTVAFVGAFPLYMSYGPFYKEAVGAETHNCRNNGWRHVLFINNFWGSQGACLGQTWYLANDMQFYMISPLLLIPLFKKPKFGLLLAGILYGVLNFITGYIVVHYNVPPTTGFNGRSEFDTEKNFYYAPYIRFQPYLIGIIIGYILYKTKGKDIKIPHVLNLVLWQASLLTLFAVVFGLVDLQKGDTITTYEWTTLESVLYNCFHRTGWSLALGWIVFSCHKGYGGVINDFLSWKAFVPLSRLTFGAYLNHIALESIVMYSETSSLYLSDFVLSWFFIGICSFSFAIAFVQALVVEIPFVNLERLLLRRSPGKKATENPNSNGYVVPVKEVPIVEKKADVEKVDDLKETKINGIEKKMES